MPSLAFPLAVNYSIPYWVPPPDDLGIVVARYREVLDPWIDVAANSYVYAKYPTPQEDDSIPHDSFKLYEELPNTGREGRTYCHHIYSHYDDLQPIIIFTQGDPKWSKKALEPPEPDFDPVTIYNHDLIRDLAEWSKINWSSPAEGYWITPSQLNTIAYAPYDMAIFWQRLFQEEHPAAVRVTHGAVFAVRREAILQHPRDLYKRCLDLFSSDGQDVANPEVGYFMERVWLALWSKKFWLSKIPGSGDV
ncbi:hypothetical protein ASPWEDRAFT_174906 [Aspergillus wentii DTO 134E9]|uniref:Uncharacterized protein n=1 Tax=Aspergillus wentii DTO 134E9 TaxID=1073089 RepID=A0A1L9RF60_ASPWE|nr:uncharacterized protein ASPWEDRAFT_174906 [Aspergillus wentii DTO 134E9]KAI9926182.1 hypothetical protein MW887_004645 [Aspergillus wentii]OJJ33503.1 hypothetical protein ASPWEDRAFT_174906 [Aspergillus wentii DTO 134E9]